LNRNGDERPMGQRAHTDKAWHGSCVGGGGDVQAGDKHLALHLLLSLHFHLATHTPSLSTALSLSHATHLKLVKRPARELLVVPRFLDGVGHPASGRQPPHNGGRGSNHGTHTANWSTSPSSVSLIATDHGILSRQTADKGGRWCVTRSAVRRCHVSACVDHRRVHVYDNSQVCWSLV
jgi:hypothetical protein